MLYVGVDIIEFSRLERPLEKYGGRFKRTVYTDKEIAACEKCGDKITAYAERFALKEAAIKAFGTGVSEGIYWIQVEYTDKGSKTLNFKGASKNFIENNGIKNVLFSVSSTSSFSIAVVILSG